MKSRQEITYPLMCILRVYSTKFNKQHFFSCMCEACGRVLYDMEMPLNKRYTHVWLETWQCSSSNVSSSRIEVMQSSPHTSQHSQHQQPCSHRNPIRHFSKRPSFSELSQGYVLTCLDTNKEALLPLLRFHPSTLQNGVGTTNPYPLDRRRRCKRQKRCFAKLCARSFQRVANGEEDSAAHEERGFA